jgi:hypothetical protein
VPALLARSRRFSALIFAWRWMFSIN